MKTIQTTATNTAHAGWFNSLCNAMQRKSNFFSALLSCPLTVGHVAGLLACSVLIAIGIVIIALAHDTGWMLFFFSLAVFAAAPAINQFIQNVDD